METNLKDLMMYYGVTIGRRFSRKEKDVFFDEMKKEYSRLGYSVKKDEKSGNIIIGDIDHSKMILAVPYDTPVKMHSDTKYYPFHLKKNVKEESKNIYFLAAGYIILFLCLFLIIKFVNINFKAKVIFIALVVCFSYLILKKRGNRVNFTRNSAGLVLTHYIAGLRENRDIAFLLLDQCANSVVGMENARNMLSGYRNPVVFLNCIASGDSFSIAVREDANEKTKETASLVYQTEMNQGKHYVTLGNDTESYLRYFKNMIQLSSGYIQDKDFVVTGTATKRDVAWDEKLLKNLARTFLEI